MLYDMMFEFVQLLFEDAVVTVVRVYSMSEKTTATAKPFNAYVP